MTFTGMSYLISLNPLHLENIAHVGSYRNLKNHVEFWRNFPNIKIIQAFLILYVNRLKMNWSKCICQNCFMLWDFRFQSQHCACATSWGKITTIWLFVNLNNNITWDGIYNRISFSEYLLNSIKFNSKLCIFTKNVFPICQFKLS